MLSAMIGLLSIWHFVRHFQEDFLFSRLFSGLQFGTGCVYHPAAGVSSSCIRNVNKQLITSLIRGRQRVQGVTSSALTKRKYARRRTTAGASSNVNRNWLHYKFRRKWVNLSSWGYKSIVKIKTGVCQSHIWREKLMTFVLSSLFTVEGGFHHACSA